MTNQLIEEFSPSVKTDVNNNTVDELSRLKYENALLQKNVSALRDENLLRDTSELLTSELEKRTRKPDGWNSPQIAYSELQINPQLEAISFPPHSQPHINKAEWRDYLNLVHCVTSSQTAQPKKSDDTPKSPQYTNNGGLEYQIEVCMVVSISLPGSIINVNLSNTHYSTYHINE